MASVEPGRMASLRDQHANLEHQIEREYSRPAPDEIALKTLKLQKLRVKEELSGMNRA